MEKEEFTRINLYKRVDKNIKIRLANKEDSKYIIEIASKSFKIDRFHLDRNLDKEKCDLLYGKSAENSIFDGFADFVYVAEYKNEVVGYISGKKNFNPTLGITFGNSIVSAVAENARGLRIYSLMNNRLLKWFYENTDIAEMGTYLTNIPVLRTKTNSGLNIIRGSYQLARFRE